MELSIIVPMMNEENNINDLYENIKKYIKNISYEVIFVNDGSVDKSGEVVRKICVKDKNIKYIEFSKNYGKDAAVFAGMKYACGKYTGIIDADMQQHPKYLLKMYEFLNKNDNYDQVVMVNNKRKNASIIKKIGGSLFYRLINSISNIHFEENASDFRMFRSNVKEAILSIDTNNKFLKGMFGWCGFNTKCIEYEVSPRLHGKSKFNIKNSFKYAFKGIVNYSNRPLILILKTGIIMSLICFIGLIYLIIRSIIIGTIYMKFMFVIDIVLLIGNINLLGIGLLGIYLSNIQYEVNGHPNYVIKDLVGFKN